MCKYQPMRQDYEANSVAIAGAAALVLCCQQILWRCHTISTCSEHSPDRRGPLWQGSHWKLRHHLWLHGSDTNVSCMVHRNDPGNVLCEDTCMLACMQQAMHALCPDLIFAFLHCNGSIRQGSSFVSHVPVPCCGQVWANNMEILLPRAAVATPAASIEWDRWQSDMLSEPRHVITNLCEALSAWLQPQPTSASILLAMLLSAVTADTSQNDMPETERSQASCHISCTFLMQQACLQQPKYCFRHLVLRTGQGVITYKIHANSAY